MEAGERNPLRLLAPAALLVFAIAFILVVSSGGGGGNGGSGAADNERVVGAPTTQTTSSRRARSSKSGGKLPQDVYVVQRGDTLGGISEKTGVPVERLQELNPGLDQFSLVAGQRIKLR